jgi:type III secretion system YscI/HrpB-like protein
MNNLTPSNTISLSLFDSGNNLEGDQISLPKDVTEFEKSLFEDPFADGIISHVDTISSSLADKKLTFEQDLAKAAKTADSNDILAATRSLSEYSLQTALLTKIASKASSAIDKLTNLH